MRITYSHFSNIVQVIVQFFETITDAHKVFGIYLTVCAIGNDITDLEKYLNVKDISVQNLKIYGFSSIILIRTINTNNINYDKFKIQRFIWR